MISIIVPSYNQQEYLADCIDSLLDQNVHGEIIIVDDGSTDGSLDIAKKYESERPDVVKVVSQVNKGLASARNTGIMNASWGWCLFLDADDMMADGGLEKLLKKIKEVDPLGIDVVSGSFKTFGTSSYEVKLIPRPTLEDFRLGNRIGSSTAVRKSALLKVGGFSPRMAKGYEDMHLWVNLLSRGSMIVTIPDIVWLYRTKEKSMWKDITPEMHSELLAQINKDFPNANIKY